MNTHIANPKRHKYVILFLESSLCFLDNEYVCNIINNVTATKIIFLDMGPPRL